MIDVLITLLILVVIFAVISYAINAFLPMDQGLKNLIMLVLGLIFVIWLLLSLTGHAPVLWRGRP